MTIHQIKSRTVVPRWKGVLKMKEELSIQITELLQMCNDLSLLDLILQLLQKSQQA